MKIFSKKKILITILVLVIFLSGKYFFFDSKKEIEKTTVKKGDIKEELVLSGEIDAKDKAVLSFGIAGKVNWVGFREGELIKKGQAVATLDKEKLEATLRKARQDFIAAKAESDKFYDGRSNGTGESYDQKIERTALDAAQNKAYDDIRIAQENLESAVLYSPIEGILITAEPKLSGVNVTATNSKYEIVNPSTIYLKVIADQTEVGSLKKGQSGTIVFDSFPDEQVKGIVEEVSFSPIEDETGTVYDVKVTLSTPKDKYRLGMTADIDFVINEKKDVLIIPLKFVNSDDKGKFVLTGQDRKKTYIEVGLEDERNAEVISGLSDGDIISL